MAEKDYIDIVKAELVEKIDQLTAAQGEVERLKEMNEHWHVRVTALKNDNGAYADKLTAANAKVEKLRGAINHATVVIGSTGDYRQGQLDALELCRNLIADTEAK